MVTTDLDVMRLEGDRRALRSIRRAIDEDSAQVTARTDFEMEEEVEVGLLITKTGARRSVPIMVFAFPTATDNFLFEVFGLRHLVTQNRRVFRCTEINGRAGWRESSIISVDPDFDFHASIQPLPPVLKP